MTCNYTKLDHVNVNAYIKFGENMSNSSQDRVGSHVVFAWIHCTDVRIHCTDILMNVGRFLYVFSSIPRKSYTIFQPTFSPIKHYQDSIFKLLTLSTNSVTNVVRTAYFQIQARSSPLKNFVT